MSIDFYPTLLHTRRQLPKCPSVPRHFVVHGRPGANVGAGLEPVEPQVEECLHTLAPVVSVDDPFDQDAAVIRFSHAACRTRRTSLLPDRETRSASGADGARPRIRAGFFIAR